MNHSNHWLLSSESVTEGHPDKICDQVSDAILDAILKQDPKARVACDCYTKTGMLLVGGEITTTAKIDIPKIARNVIKDAGYIKAEYGIHADTCAILVNVSEQSPDIASGINASTTKEQGAGDQGMMYGYATTETPELMPLPIMLAHQLTKQMATVRKNGSLPFLRPDGKAMATIEYNQDGPLRLHTVLVSAQHDETITLESLRNEIFKHIILPASRTNREWIDKDTIILVNPAGQFVQGGPQADSGMTGRKNIVDTYGGYGSHGGGAFSGKDPSKVDRSGAYLARYIAKNIVAAELAHRCEVQISYAIGLAEPVSLYINSHGTGKITDRELEKRIYHLFPLKPSDIIKELDLLQPIYRKTAVYGHFGRESEGFNWEKTDRATQLKI